MPESPLSEVPGLHRAGLDARGSVPLRAENLRPDAPCNRLADLVLKLEDVLKLAIVVVRPDVLPRRGVDKLRGDADSASRPAYAPFHHVANAQLMADLLDIDRSPPVDEAGVAGDDRERPP